MSANILVSNILRNFGGVTRNNLNNLINNADDLDNAISIASDSPYIDTDNLTEYLKPFSENFSVLGLNVQCLNAKFDKFKALLNELSNDDFEFSAICIQETWLEGTNPSMCLYELENYVSIPLGATCSSHSGLVIYLHQNYQYIVRDLYSPNKNWEGQFIDVFGNGLKQKITLCNIYRPPRDRNDDIELVRNDLAPILAMLSQERSDKLILGDFNIDLLKVNTREEFSDFLNEMLNKK